MVIDEASRLRLYESARRALGESEADTLMAGLAPAGTDWNGLRNDFSELRAEFSELRDDMREEMGRLRSEFGDLRGEFGELRGEFGELRGELRGEMGKLEARLLEKMTDQTRTFVLAMVASQFTFGGILLGALRLGAGA